MKYRGLRIGWGAYWPCLGGGVHGDDQGTNINFLEILLHWINANCARPFIQM